MKVTELNREQINELKQSLATLIKDEQGQDISYEELVNATEVISDKEVFEYYEGIEFTEDDFSQERNENC